MRIGLLTVSDRAASGEYEDRTGPAVRNHVESWADVEVIYQEITADEQLIITTLLKNWSEDVDLILTHGGTGLGLRDVTPEATRDAITREVPGIAEVMRAEGYKATPFAALSRQVAGQIGHCLVVNLPGSPGGAVESLESIAEILQHGVQVIRNVDHAP